MQIRSVIKGQNYLIHFLIFRIVFDAPNICESIKSSNEQQNIMQVRNLSCSPIKNNQCILPGSSETYFEIGSGLWESWPQEEPKMILVSSGNPADNYISGRNDDLPLSTYMQITVGVL